ncbi:hypothetical protein [Helicobacter sp. 13S00477-4]|uniref:hypothetical protein n=1 Tax=Helicobacter sp. 13S00477-4 TaxID=1905759 RepID=UPI000BA5F9DF|nr:hypothetical protein [Helicobacter sp. 13S00477-4]PAF52177.1 hypothetical protein BKH44_03495 [Helicobacter sp. 13S00477-4]
MIFDFNPIAIQISYGLNEKIALGAGVGLGAQLGVYEIGRRKEYNGSTTKYYTYGETSYSLPLNFDLSYEHYLGTSYTFGGIIDSLSVYFGFHNPAFHSF